MKSARVSIENSLLAVENYYMFQRKDGHEMTYFNFDLSLKLQW